MTVSKGPVACTVLYTHHSAHGSRFLHPEGLHHLEDVHYSLRLAPLNGGGYGTEHARAAHRVTVGNTHTVNSHTRCSQSTETSLDLTCSGPQWGGFQSSSGSWTSLQSRQSHWSGWSSGHQRSSWLCGAAPPGGPCPTRADRMIKVTILNNKRETTMLETKLQAVGVDE